MHAYAFSIDQKMLHFEGLLLDYSATEDRVEPSPFLKNEKMDNKVILFQEIKNVTNELLNFTLK